MNLLEILAFVRDHNVMVFSSTSTHQHQHFQKPSKMHFPKLRDLFRRKVTNTETVEAVDPDVPSTVLPVAALPSVVSRVSQEDAVDKPLPPLPASEGCPIYTTNAPLDTRICRMGHSSYQPLYWPNADRAPSMMHFYVPSRSSSPASSSSATTIPQGLFHEFSQTLKQNETDSSSDLRPGAISRLGIDSPRCDSKLHGSITIQCHPAILDNPPPFQRYSSPPKLKADPNHGQQAAQQNEHIRRQASILETQTDLLTTRLEQTIQDLSDMTCTRDVTRQMLEICNAMRLQAEELCQTLASKYRQVYTGIESLLRANNAMEKDLRDLEKVHSTCTQREAVLQERIDILLTSRWRGSGYLKRRLIETNDRNNTLADGNFRQTAALECLRKRNITLEHRAAADERSIASLEEKLRRAKEERDEDTEAFQLAEKEAYQLSEKLRAAQTTLKETSTKLEEVVQERARLSSLLQLTGSCE